MQHHLRGLSAQIVLWAILPLSLVLVAVSFGSITLHERSMADMAVRRNEEQAELAASRLNDNLQWHVLILRTLLERTQDSAGARQSATADSLLLDTFDHGLALFPTPAGSSAPVPLVGVGIPLTASVVLTAALQHPGQPAFALIPLSGQPDAVVMGLAHGEAGPVIIGVDSVQSLVRPALRGTVDTAGRMMVSVLDGDGRTILPQSTSAMPGDSPHGSGDTGDQLVSQAIVPLTGWRLLVGESWADMAMPVLRYTLLAPLVVLVAAIASLAAIYVGFQAVIRPLQALGRQASRLAWGDFGAIETPVEGIAEIQDLQHTLQTMAHQVGQYQAGMRDYIAALTQAQEDERKRLARELHDETIQSLIAVSQRARMLELEVVGCEGQPGPDLLDRIQRHMQELAEMAHQSLNNLRDLIRDLRPIYLEELGLEPALEMLAENSQKEGLAVSLEVVGSQERIAPDIELAVYRIAQAGINNALRHAQASDLWLRLTYLPDEVTLAVEDNGVGFVPPEVPGSLAAQGHFGLIGMYERATRLGGYLSIHSAPGQGAKIIASVPLTPAP